eukprot:1280180-Prymnesium_polylepis.1
MGAGLCWAGALACSRKLESRCDGACGPAMPSQRYQASAVVVAGMRPSTVTVETESVPCAWCSVMSPKLKLMICGVNGSYNIRTRHGGREQ